MPLPYIRFENVHCVAGEGFYLDFFVLSENVTKRSKFFPKSAGFPLAIAAFAAAKVNQNASLALPELEGMHLIGLEDMGAALLTFYPGPLEDGGLVALMALLAPADM